MVFEIFILQVAQVSAKEYYCGVSNYGYSVYFLSETARKRGSNYNSDIACNTRCVKNGNTIYVAWFFKSSGGWRYAHSDDAPYNKWYSVDSSKLGTNVFRCAHEMVYLGVVAH